MTNNTTLAMLLGQTAKADTAAPLRVDLEKARNAMAKAASYKIGDGRETLLEIEECVRQSQYNDADRASIAKMLGDVVTGNGTKDSKAFACRQLWIIGTPEESLTLRAALQNPELSDMARYALQNMEGSGADDVLMEAALLSTDPKTQIGAINSLAMRKSMGALDAIKSLKKSKDKDVAEAAKHAIGRLKGKIVP